MSQFVNSKDGVSEIFGSKVFNASVMRKRLPKAVYGSLLKTMQEGLPLEENVADVIAQAMMDWAMEQGATHFTHWFQPMTGITAEKHDSFINPTEEGKVIMSFSGKELIKGEPDASSFPSGGLRATFEARGYTAWDPTSYAFIKGSTLCIPTIFCSYSGEILDKKAPLLRSMETLNTEALRILNLFGKNNVKKVTTTIGAEQEYFLIERDMFKQRKDLILTGRTLFGGKPPKGQELEDHYFGSIRGRVHAYMKDLDRELWELGIASKTRHNEVAPSQHELAPIFTTTNIATDNNQLIMEFMKRVAYRHNLACLLHEKPFAGVNGSGKHNNWSMSTDTGENLLEPGKNPVENKQFLLFLCATIEAVNKYSEMLRISVATAGNDHRLGANEAPPAIMSVFLGEQLTAALKSIETGKPVSKAKDLVLEMGIDTMPKLIIDATDRNRTSPFAFTGNKFEFRMLGSSQSISGPNITLNTIVAEILGQYADVLEKAEDFESALDALLQKSVKENKRIVFNGNNYSEDWVKEAERRGLPNLKTTPEALKHFISEKNVALYEKHKIFTAAEIASRYEIHLEEYIKTINIEALTMLDLAKRQILPGVLSYSKELSESLLAKKACALDLDLSAESELITEISKNSGALIKSIQQLEEALEKVGSFETPQEEADYYCDAIISNMNTLRTYADALESVVGEKYWPFPIYEDILFYV
ncbi:MAG: glutamine synthetase III [Eubacteriaceae bacterium]